MIRLPLFKFSRRARSTSYSIALCTMFIVASFSVLDGIRTSTEKLRSNFESEFWLVTADAPSEFAYFTSADMGDSAAKSALGRFIECEVLPVSEMLTVFSITDPSHILVESFTALTGANVLEGADLLLPSNVTLSGSPATVSGKFSSSIFSPEWIMASEQLTRALSNQDGYNFAISKSLTQTEIETLQESGFSVLSMTGIVDFLDAGVGEVEKDTFWVLVPSAFAIGVLAYSFIGSETADKRHEIGILKTIGAGRRKILGYLLANSAIICAWGGLLGLAFGIILSYGLTTGASSIFSSVFIIKASLPLIIEAYIFTLLAGILGGALPAIRMTLTTPAEDLKEVVP